MITNPDTINAWFHGQKIYRGITINEDGTVDYTGNLAITVNPIPFQFGTITGHFSTTALNIETFEGFPRIIKGHFSVFGSNAASMSGLHKHVRHIGGQVVCRTDATHLLGLLLIDGVENIDVDRGPIDKILMNHIGAHDVISCQDELLDAGFVEQAKL